MTSEKQKMWARQYYQRNREKVLKRNRAYQAAHPLTPEDRAIRNFKQRLRYRDDDEYREEQKAYARHYYQNHKKQSNG